MNIVNKETRLQTEIEGLNKQLSPSRDLWNGIDLALTHQDVSTLVDSNRPNAVVPLSWAASVVAAVLVTWLWLGPAKEGELLPATVIAMEKQFKEDKLVMLVGLGEPDLTQLSPEMKAQFAQLTSARKSLEKALIEEPNNADLLNLLAWLHQQELALLEQLFQPQWQAI